MAERQGKRWTSQPARAPGGRGESDAATQLEFVSPRVVFAELIAGALRSLGMDPSPLAISYVIGLMELHVRAPDSTGESETLTLAETLLTALSESGQAQIFRLRDLGDRALFVSGFFGESLCGSDPGLDYYRDVGRTAYGRLSAQFAHSTDEGGWRELYEELADEFGAFSDLLCEVGVQIRPEETINLLVVYDRYLETGSRRDRAKLIRNGLVLPASDALGRRQ